MAWRVAAHVALTLSVPPVRPPCPLSPSRRRILNSQRALGARADVCQTDSTCQAVSLAAPSQAARQKKKRFVVGPGAGVAKFFGECKRGFTACLVASSEHSENYEVRSSPCLLSAVEWLTEYDEQCVNTDSNLEQCGGCANDGGVDCTDLPGVEGVMCDAGRCVVLSCKPGLERSTDLAACV